MVLALATMAYSQHRDLTRRRLGLKPQPSPSPLVPPAPSPLPTTDNQAVPQRLPLRLTNTYRATPSDRCTFWDQLDSLSLINAHFGRVVGANYGLFTEHYLAL